MSDGNNNNNDEPRSTDSNLPILFANGYPTSLEKMTKDQLEKFIPFLIQCSRVGCDNEDENEVPIWWPSTVKYQIPLEKPKKYKKNWEMVLRNIIKSCYDHHKHSFLLKYSRDLSENERANLRYVKATETTTDLYSRDPKKLLLTFRNENMLYDKKQRMTLIPKKTLLSSPVPEEEDSSTFDIMLCDFCDAEFYSDEAFMEHEKKCGESKEEPEPIENIIISDDEDVEETFGDQNEFLQYFRLCGRTTERLQTRKQSIVERSLSPKKKKASQRARREMMRREKEMESIPFSSPAGIILTKKTAMSQKEIEDGLEEIEENCVAKPDTKIPSRSKRSNMSGSENAVIRSMREPRHYYWPKRVLSTASKEKNFELLNRALIQKMKPCQVKVEMLTEAKLQAELTKLSSRREEKLRADCVDLCSESDESVELELGVSMETIDETVQETKPPVAMFYERRLDVASLFSSSFFPATPTLSAANSFSFVSQQQASLSNGEESTSSQTVFQRVVVTASPSTSSATSSKRSIEETDSGQGMVNRWLQNIPSENFSMPNQVSLMNTN